MGLPQTSAGQAPVCRVINEKLAANLQAFNSLTRDLRTKGIKVLRMDLNLMSMHIEAADSDLLTEHFGCDMSGLLTINLRNVRTTRVTLRGAVQLVWERRIVEGLLA